MTIYLYVKQCSHCNLKYFGKTIQDPFKYKGSGKYWSYHIKKHANNKVINCDVFSFNCQNEANKFALNFSEKNDIVNSKDWANLIVEDASNSIPVDINVNRKISNETKLKMSLSRKKYLENNIHPSIGKPAWNKNKKIWSKEDRLKMSKNRKGKSNNSSGSKNMIWVNNGIKNKLINPELLNDLPGFKKGRLLSPEHKEKFTRF
jgi:hypothetical protein